MIDPILAKSWTLVPNSTPAQSFEFCNARNTVAANGQHIQVTWTRPHPQSTAAWMKDKAVFTVILRSVWIEWISIPLLSSKNDVYQLRAIREPAEIRPSPVGYRENERRKENRRRRPSALPPSASSPLPRRRVETRRYGEEIRNLLGGDGRRIVIGFVTAGCWVIAQQAAWSRNNSYESLGRWKKNGIRIGCAGNTCPPAISYCSTANSNRTCNSNRENKCKGTFKGVFVGWCGLLVDTVAKPWNRLEQSFTFTCFDYGKSIAGYHQTNELKFIQIRAFISR